MPKGTINLLIRYTKAADGKSVPQAEVYTKDEHRISLDSIDPDALFICRKLRQAGFEAYIVGGAVRDLLLGKKPKDFDISTNAHPKAIKKVLPFSRIIGKRFRLVHVYFPGDKIIEVATFRSNVAGDANVFGTLEDDAKRRDFSMNALYFDPKDQYVIDQVGGVKDIRKKRLSHVIPLDIIFDEDPVRMLRAVKYATASGFSIPGPIAAKIRAKASLMAGISPSRLTEEFYKILFSGKARLVLPALAKYGVLQYFVPNFHRYLKAGLFSPKPAKFLQFLDLLDEEVKKGEALDRSDLMRVLLFPLLANEGWQAKATTDNFETLVSWIKEFFKPIIPSNKEIDTALRDIYRLWAVRAPRKRPPRPPRGRSGGGGSHGNAPSRPHKPNAE